MSNVDATRIRTSVLCIIVQDLPLFFISNLDHKYNSEIEGKKLYLTI